MVMRNQHARTSILERINGPQDLKMLSKSALRQLAKEIRAKITATVAKNGGHLGSSLGVVELSIALHYVFDSPKDKIIWDTSHQAYAHKLLTGRNKKFHTLRQYKGLSGFCSIKESEHDAFGTGHASTSISAALGIAKARDIKNENHKVIAVIGDGSLTGGMAFEGLNNAGMLKTGLIIILNDNKMSISPNVGALAYYLNKVVLSKKYFEILKGTEKFLRGIPAIGNERAKRIVELQEKLRTFATPGLIFEELGFKYFGPLNGHNLDELINALKTIRGLHGPVLLHVKTEKGKGYSIAENDAYKCHGMSPFNIDNGEKLKKPDKATYTEVFGKTLTRLAGKNEKIVAITAAMKNGTGLDEFAEEFPERFFDVGIAEEHAVTFAGGLAVKGLKPVCAIYSTFLQRSYDQIIHDIALQELPVIFAIDRAGLVGDDGPTHNGPFDIAYMRTIPNMTIMVPKDENELQHMLYTATLLNSPSSVRYPRGEGVGVKLDKTLKKLPVGKGEVLKKGADVLIIGVGPILYEALRAAEESTKSVAVVNARFAKPLDKHLILKLARKTGNIITIEEGTIRGGFGSAVLELLEENNVKANVKVLGVPDRFIEQAKQEKQMEICGLTKENILKTINLMVR
jgi:1-deoxy-D-xylulose-5-phosphate synthase